MQELLFPYSKIRKTQDSMIETIQEALTTKKNLLMHAPTGIGKTAAIFSTILPFAIKNNLTIFFLTSKHTQHKLAIETLQLIKNKFKINLPVIDFIGKKWMCPVPGTNTLSNSEFHEYCNEVMKKETCNYYVNFKSKDNRAKLQTLITQLQSKSPLHVEELCKITSDELFCPYEVSANLARKSKVIIADYYHILSPSIRDSMLKRIHKELYNSIIIIDEAHNLPQRTRDLLTTSLSTYTIDKAIKEAKQFKYPQENLQLIKKILENLVKKIPIQETEILIKKEELTNLLQNYEKIISEFEFIADEIRENKKRSFIGSIANFLDAWLGPDHSFARILSKGFLKNNKPFIALSYKCLDPSLLTKPLIDNSYITICMSGTLTPLEMYEDLLGFTNCIKKEFLSPFPEENKLTLIVPQTTTKFSKRTPDQYKNIANILSTTIEKIPGNTLVFFPSYEIRDNVNNYLITDKTTFLEHKDMTKQDKDIVIEKFKTYNKTGALLLAVSSGSFGEGIDLKGDFLKAVIIVGLPLAKPDLETKELINYYDEKFFKGWEYGYTLPAITKILQNAGRCIRSETDKGLILFLDERYCWPTYYKCFPQEKNINITKTPEYRIEGFFSE